MHDEPATAVVEPTYRVLCDHGYVDLSLQDGAGADTSEASLHSHYERKGLLSAVFLDFPYATDAERLTAPAGEPSRERLDSRFETSLIDEPREVAR